MTDTSVKVLLCSVKKYIFFIHTQKTVFEVLIFKGGFVFPVNLQVLPNEPRVDNSGVRQGPGPDQEGHSRHQGAVISHVDI